MKASVSILVLAQILVMPGARVLAAPPAATDPTVALVSKVILDVKRKEPDRDWGVAKRGQTLASGDRVRTGMNSLAVIKFKDNSLVRVREQSELTVTGDVSGSAFSKSVNLTKGSVGFNIQKQQSGEEFSFRSPTSVASIRGTEGIFIAGTLEDLLTVLEGKIGFQNRISNSKVDVDAGYTGIAKPDGTILTRPSTPAEKSVARNAMIEREDEQRNLLELEFRDGQGNRKQMRIDFK